MWKDPIVEKIHQIRAKILAEHNNDIHALLAYYRAQQHREGHKVVSRIKKTKATRKTDD